MTNGHGRHAVRQEPSGAPKRARVDLGRISTIRAGQGAKVTTRKNASEAADHARHSAEKRYYERHPEARSSAGGPPRSGRNVVLLVVAAILALCLVFLLGRCVAGIIAPGDDGQDSRPEQTLRPTEDEQAAIDQQSQHDTGQEQAGPDGSVSYRGDTYSLQMQEDGLWGLVRTGSSGTTETLFEVEGTPTALLRNVDTILVPENRNGGWDVVCYVIGGHGQASYVIDDTGAMIQGSGEIESAELEGTILRVTDTTGQTRDISLV